MIKEIHAKNRAQVLVIIMVVLNVILVPCSIVSFVAEIYVAALSIFITAIIFDIVFLCCIASVNKSQKKHEEILEKGYMVSGEVVSFGHKRHKRKDGPDRHYYWLDIKYTDKDGQEHIYKSPNLSFVPKETSNVTCDVYIYNNEIYVTNFVNLYKFI